MIELQTGVIISYRDKLMKLTSMNRTCRFVGCDEHGVMNNEIMLCPIELVDKLIKYGLITIVSKP